MPLSSMAVVDQGVDERSCDVDLFADPNGSKTGLDAGYMFPGWGSRSFPRMDALRTVGNAFSQAFGILGHLGQGPA